MGYESAMALVGEVGILVDIALHRHRVCYHFSVGHMTLVILVSTFQCNILPGPGASPFIAHAGTCARNELEMS